MSGIPSAFTTSLLVSVAPLGASALSQEPARLADFTPAVYWTGAALALSLILWAAARATRWGAAAGWTALALAGQACALQLVQAGPDIKLQLFQEWKILLSSCRGIFLAAVVLHGAIVAWGARKWWSTARTHWPNVLSWPQGLVLLLLAAYSATTIAPGVAQAFVHGGFADQALRHFTKVALGLFIFGAGGLCLALAVAAIPAEGWNRLSGWWQRLDRSRLPIFCALWVVAISLLLSWLALDFMPHVPDEVMYIFQAKYISAGHLYLPAPIEPEAVWSPFGMIDGDKWYSAMQAVGWTSVLAVGYLADVPWLLNPLFGGISILLAHVLVRRLYTRGVADGVVLLLAVSPWLLFLCASLMPHAISLVLSLAALLAAERVRATGGMGWAALAGLSFGALLLVRSLEAVAIASVVGIWWLSAGWKKLRIPALATTLAVGFVMTGLYLAYNKTLTGDPFQVPYNKWSDHKYYPGSNRLGFGADVGNYGWTGLDALPGHGPIDVVMNTSQNFYLLNFELFGWACGSLPFVFLLFVWRQWRSDALMWGLVFSIWASMSLYWFSGGPDFGARYWFQMAVPMALLTFRGAEVLIQRMAVTGRTASVASAQRVWAFIGLASLLGLVNLLPWRSFDKYHHYRGIRPDFRKLDRQYHFGRSLVFVRGERWPDYASAFPFNPPALDPDASGPIFLRDLGPESNRQLRSHYRGRPMWVVEGPSVTGGAARVIAGPIPSGESAAPDKP